ncbi:cardiolipin synthase [Sutcliffiella cohnii]
MVIITVVLFALFLLIMLAILDFKLGRKKHLAEVEHDVFPKRKSNISLFTDGGTLFKHMYDDLREAKEHIHALFYIVREDHISKEFLSILKEKAEEGLEVRLLMDWGGSFKFKKETVQQLKGSGVEVYFCHPPKFPHLFYSINERNHRKITIIDGKIGYVGGYNVGKEYVDQDAKMGVWRDYHLKVTGEGVKDLQFQFLQDWKDDTGIDLRENNQYYPPLTPGEITHQFVPTNGAFLTETFVSLIKKAKKQIIIATPYFIPSDELIKELFKALNRGVKVSVLVPQKEDHLLLRDAGFNYFPALMQAGATIYRFYYGFYHAKVMVIDEEICDIGTANFDKRSLFLNHEINCLIYDSEFVQCVLHEIQEDMHNSEVLTPDYLKKRSFLAKGKQRVAKILSPLL